MIRRIVERPKALEDLHSIASYIASDNLSASRRVIEAVADTYLHLAEYPEISRKVEGDFRMMPVIGFKQYLVLYIWSGDVVEILRVIRSEQDYWKIIGLSN